MRMLKNCIFSNLEMLVKATFIIFFLTLMGAWMTFIVCPNIALSCIRTCTQFDSLTFALLSATTTRACKSATYQELFFSFSLDCYIQALHSHLRNENMWKWKREKRTIKLYWKLLGALIKNTIDDLQQQQPRAFHFPQLLLSLLVVFCNNFKPSLFLLYAWMCNVWCC